MRSLVFKAALCDGAVAIGSFTMLTIAMSIWAHRGNCVNCLFRPIGAPALACILSLPRVSVQDTGIAISYCVSTGKLI